MADDDTRYDYIPTFEKLGELTDDGVIARYDEAAKARSHAPASFFLDELRRRESARREQESAGREKRMVILTWVIAALTLAITAATLHTIFDDEPSNDPPGYRYRHEHR
jgi:hypothetical protein